MLVFMVAQWKLPKPVMINRWKDIYIYIHFSLNVSPDHANKISITNINIKC